MKTVAVGRSPVAVVIAVALAMATCRTIQQPPALIRAELRTDSTEIGVRFTGQYYLAKIGFVFVNSTAGPVSIAGCGGPPMPQLEKLVNGSWVGAYYPPYLMCRTIPDFSVEPGATYRSEVNFMASPHGSSQTTPLEVDSVDGVYRLRWVLTAGRVAGAAGARRVEAISNQFRMILR